MAARIDTRMEGLVARITVCNAAKLNILDTRLIAELTAAFKAVAADPALRAVVLAGEGERAFIGGADITEMAHFTPATGRAFIIALHGACAAVRACPVPVIARMQGLTLGGGLEVAAACDIRVAAEGARFGMPETRIGIPSVIEAALLPQLIGWGRTRRLLFTGEIIGTELAERWGLVEEVAPAAGLDAAIERVLADILACGPRAIRLQKELIGAWEELTPSAAIARGIDCFEESWRAEEPGRMMAAFLAAKRK
jgi:enoyl-CoA hydratase/carnithine racemase